MHLNYRRFLAHHGIKGQKWGIRRGPPYPIESTSNSTDVCVSRGRNAVKRVLLAAALMPIGMVPSNGNKKNYAKSNLHDKLNSSSKPTIRLPKPEYAHVMSEVATNVTKEQRYNERVFSKNIGGSTYVFENGFDGTFRVIGKYPINASYDYYTGRFDDENK